MARWTVRQWLPALALLWAIPGCYTGVENSADDVGEDAGDADGDGDAGGDGDGDGDGAELPAPSPRIYRLTHEQWENTVQDLFGLPEPTGASSLFRDDPQTAGYIFDNDPLSLEVDDSLWTGYRLASAQVAEQVIADPAVLASLMPPDAPSEAERIENFTREFATRAYRRPPSEDEVSELVDLFLAAPSMYPGVDDAFVAGIRHVIEAVLQSPFFLYRVESSAEVVGGVIPLSDYELASRLSYFLWNTMPDEALFAAAAAGELHTADDVASQATRMIQDPRAADMAVRFHYQLLKAKKIKGIQPSPNAFPNLPADFAELAYQEHELFVRDVVFGGGGGLRELLTSNESFVNDDLAAIYGIEGVMGDEFVSVEFDPAQRKGIFTQVGWLASNATSVHPDPIHRGVFLSETMFCNVIAAPPDVVPPVPPLDPDQTNRERVHAHTGVGDCAQCHNTLINPFGFAFEGYDAIGGFRTMDNGQPVDTTADIQIDTQIVSVNDAVELVDAMATSERIHQCYTRHWLEYSMGRNFDAATDFALVSRLGAASLDEGASIQDLLVELTVSPYFLNRAAEELP